MAILAAAMGTGHWLAAQNCGKFAARSYCEDAVAWRFYQRLRWGIAAAVAPRVAKGWFDEMSRPPLSSFADANPRLALKPMRVYMSTRWDRPRRVKVILDTYRFIHSRGGTLQNALLQSGGSVLARTDANGCGAVSIVLGVHNRFRKEGELVVSLLCEASNVAYMSFSLENRPDGGLCLYIGCIQGSDGHKDEIKALSKAMHGLRPKALLVFVAQELARALGASDLMGVGNDILAHRCKHLIRIPFCHDLTFDYDTVWSENGGRPGPNGWFHLPLASQRRAPEEIKTNKRAMYQRRYAMLDGLSRQIGAALLG